MALITIDDRRLEAPGGTYLLKAAREAGIHIPTLCHHEALEPWGGCRLCIVEITRESWEGWSKLVISCIYKVEDGLIVKTSSPRVMEARRVVLDLLLARCPDTPLIKKLAAEYGIRETTYERNPEPTDCILCGLCTRVCEQIGVSAISASSRGADRKISAPFDEPPQDCIGCLSCAEICPTGCIPFSENGLQRIIWKKEFEMLRCARCGKATITKDQACHFAKRQGVPEKYFEHCDDCKRDEHAALFEKLMSG
ncbi:2Fe-2S iron-sulfur cluster-binding protein [Acidobacteriota bacterium]